MALIGSSLDFQLEANTEIYNLFSPDVQFAVEMDRHVKRVIIALPYLQTSVSGFAVSVYLFRCVVNGLKTGEDLVEVTCKELEHSRFPGSTLEGGVKKVLAYGITDHVLVEVIGDELLGVAIDPKSRMKYLGVRGRMGTGRKGHLQSVASSA